MALQRDQGMKKGKEKKVRESTEKDTEGNKETILIMRKTEGKQPKKIKVCML